MSVLKFGFRRANGTFIGGRKQTIITRTVCKDTVSRTLILGSKLAETGFHPNPAMKSGQVLTYAIGGGNNKTENTFFT